MKALLIIAGFTISLIALCIVCGILVYVPERQIRAALANVLFVAEVGAIGLFVASLLLVAIAIVAGLCWLAYAGYNKAVVWRHSQQIKAAEAQRAKFWTTTAGNDDQVYTHEITPHGIVTRPAYLVAGEMNGAIVEPTPQQIGMWYTVHSRGAGESAQPAREVLQLESPLPDYVDLSDHVNGITSLRNIFLGVGRFPDGQVRPVRAPLGRLVHIAQAGSSGFGKSTSMLSLAYQAVNAKENPRVIMIDAQAVTFTPFEGHASLLHPLVSEPKDVLFVLNELVGEMKRRQELFSHWRGVSKLSQYNEIVLPGERLPEIPVFFDEFALLADNKQISAAVTTLARGCRKAGLYFIASAQTWKSDEISTAIRANLSTTIQFYARDKAQSRVLLGSSIAADITIQGRAYCILPGQHGLIEMQAPDTSNVIDVEPVYIEAGERVVFEASEPEPDEFEIADDYFVGLVEGGMSRRQAALEAYGKDYAGAIVTRGKRALGEIN